MTSKLKASIVCGCEMQCCIRTRSYIGPITPTPNRPFSVPSIWMWSEKSIAITQHHNYPTRGPFNGPLLLVCSANCEIVRPSCYTWVLESDMDCVTIWIWFKQELVGNSGDKNTVVCSTSILVVFALKRLPRICINAKLCLKLYTSLLFNTSFCGGNRDGIMQNKLLPM